MLYSVHVVMHMADVVYIKGAALAAGLGPVPPWTPPDPCTEGPSNDGKSDAKMVAEMMATRIPNCNQNW